MKTITLLLFIFGCSILYLVAEEEDTPIPAWKQKFPARLYINEICIRPEKDGYPRWLEFWNHTDKDINLKGYKIRTLEEELIIGNDFVIGSENLGLVLIYDGATASDEFENRLPDTCPKYHFFQKKIFPYGYLSKNPIERSAENADNFIIFSSAAGELYLVAFWGWSFPVKFQELIKAAVEKNIDAVASDMFGKVNIYPGCSMLLESSDRFKLLTRGTSTPGRFYPKEIIAPIVESSFAFFPPTIDPLSLDLPEEISQEKEDKTLAAGKIVLKVKEVGLNLSVDLNNGWDKIRFELAYDNEFKMPVLSDEKKKKCLFYYPSSRFDIQFSFEDYLYLVGEKLYYYVERQNINGTIVRSEIGSAIVPFVNISHASSIGNTLSLEDIPKSHNEINHLDDVEHLKKVNALVSKLKTVVNAIGVFDVYRFHETVEKSEKMGHLKELKISPDLSSVYMHIYLHNFQCLKQNPSNSLVNCGGNTDDLYKILTPVRDFSFLRGFENLRLDLSENDVPAMGGLELVLKELNKYCKPKGLKLEVAQLKDISALKGSTVEELNLSFNYYLKEISPLSGAPNLKRLNIEKLARRDKIDLSPLATCPKLEVLKFTPDGCENVSALKNIPTLKEINGESAEEFFKRNGL